MDNLQNYLDTKKCFKLILGAGNQNYDEIVKLCALYSKAGARFFDVNASLEAVRSAKKGFGFSNSENCFICISVGTKNDPHISKYKITRNNCSGCGMCGNICPQSAIVNFEGVCSVDESKCIGCGRCFEVCPNNSIEKYSLQVPLEELLPPLIEEGTDCIEYHINSFDEDEIMSGWSTITKLYGGVLSICTDRSKLGNEKLIERLKKMKAACSNLVMIQADGAPMSGGQDDFRTTLQAVATADIIEKAKITPYIIMSGGTNSKTMELAKLCSLDISGIAIGSFARKIVKHYIEKDNFLDDNEAFNEALIVAKHLVEGVNI